MIRILATAALALSLTASGAFATSWDDLIYVDGLHYKKFTPEPFTGEVDEGKFQGAMKNGKFEGPWVRYWSNGGLRSKGAYKNGKREGPWVEYYENGLKDSEASGTYRNDEKVSD